MPLYFFHLSFGERVAPDEEGTELPNRLAARNEALAVVRDLANPEIGGSTRRWASWFLEVADEAGGFFRTPIGHPALEVVRSDAYEARTEEPTSKPAPPAAIAPLPEVTAARARTAEIVRQMAARQKTTAQLLKDNAELRRELSLVCLASQWIRLRTGRLVSVARAAGGRA